MKDHNKFEILLDHISNLGMKYVPKEELLHILEKNLTNEEANVLLALPNKVIPFQGLTANEIAEKLTISFSDLKKSLENLLSKGLLYCRKREEDGEIVFSIPQIGYGFPQVFFWKGTDTPHAREMAEYVIQYFNKEITKEIFATNPIPYRFLPVDESIEIEIQAVVPYQVMNNIIMTSKVIAVANCSCRMISKLKGKPCNHPLEVCMKFNDLATYLIENGFAREISKSEALEISKRASESGLVHFTDNVIDNIQQNCNCCGCSCWNLGLIRRRRIPRDQIIATYFIRETQTDNCNACASCIDICPTNAISIENYKAIVSKEWCIGCGLCFSKCTNNAIKIVLRDDLTHKIPEKDFNILHEKILKNRA